MAVTEEIALHTAVASHDTHFPTIIKFTNYSKLERLIRIMAYCLRYIDIAIHKLSPKGPFTAEELQQATIVLDGTLRIGGRLGHSDFPLNKRQPMILSSKHHLTKLLFESEHKRLLHIGPQALLAQMKEQYWTISGRNLARQVVQRCIRCFRNKPRTITPQMADLHRDRVNPTPAFYNTGVDYAGPINTKDRKGRGGRTYKSYICLFVCLTTKAIHLELVSDLTTEGFILALRRFVARRGMPNKISSGNGTNLVGAHSELLRLGEFLTKNEGELASHLASERINWSFIPSYSPHFGAVPCPNVTDIKESRLSRYQRIQQIQQNFWKRWSKEFIFELQCRTKWRENQGKLKIGDLVLIKDDNLPPLRWRLGRVVELHPGIDLVTRAATVRTAKGLSRRVTLKLCPLPIEATPQEADPQQSNI
ncbi:PREDICTED: uncharacterized protein LOC108782025 [Cyphomyrmex costatus]|uniref:uncharacterized protein LOC108782025 n=1 Tax=Cyphomyrmex costatus TaxID=456900 RepID=UPI00085241EF|nr:PREDICTED: uncharacterized protein LOC108782025 [Cyphomyrmex costatus]